MEQAFHTVVLSDGVTGHLRQLEAVLEDLEDVLRRKGWPPSRVTHEIVEIDVKFARGWLDRFFFYLRHPRAGACRVCDRCQLYFLKDSDLERLSAMRADLVISPFGRRTSDANRWMASRCGARSIVLMTPKAGFEGFDLAIVPRHDNVPQWSNVVVTEGAPNKIKPGSLRLEAEKLEKEAGPFSPLRIGLLLGGDSKHFRMDEADIGAIVDQLLEASRDLEADYFVTTSRRTPPAIERLLKDRLGADPRCKLLILANEKNRPGTVPAILGVSQVVIVSPETVNMVSEAASSGAHVLAFQAEGFLGEKHRRFLGNLAERGHILTPAMDQISSLIKDFSRDGRRTRRLDDAGRIRQALERLLDDPASHAAARNARAGFSQTTKRRENTESLRNA